VKRKGDADELAKACRIVLQAAGVPLPSEKLRRSSDYVTAERVKPSLGPGALFGYAALERGNGSEAVTLALKGVADLERWARQLSDWQARKKKSAAPGKGGRPPNVALDKLFDDLEEIYRDEWNWIPTDPKQVVALLEPQSPWPPPVASLVTSKEAMNGGDWREVWAAHGLNASDFDTGNNEATGQISRTSETVLQDTGAARPLGFFRLIWEVMFRLDERGIPVGELKPGAIERAWRRRRDQQQPPDKIG
jgi:hypothetical protein